MRHDLALHEPTLADLIASRPDVRRKIDAIFMACADDDYSQPLRNAKRNITNIKNNNLRMRRCTSTAVLCRDVLEAIEQYEGEIV